MFDIGFWEVAFIGLLALLILGPQRLPEAARSAGQWVGKLRAFISNIKQDLDSQLQSNELAELRRLKDELLQARESLQQTSQSVVNSISDSLNDEQGTGSKVKHDNMDFIDDAVSGFESTNKTRKPRRKNGKPAVVKRKKPSARKKVTNKKATSKKVPGKTTKSRSGARKKKK